MSYKLTYGIVRYQQRKVIHVLRNVGDDLAVWEIDGLMEAAREHMLSRHGEQTPAIVIVQGSTRETLRLFGDSYAIALARAAMFNGAISWSPFRLD